MVWFALGLVIGIVIGAAVVFAVSRVQSRSSQRQLRETFSALASEALDANSQRLVERSGVALQGKKELIDQAVAAINERLGKMGEYFHRVEAERKQDLGRLGGSVSQLSTTTGELHKMLASTQRRGAWGERMADDILRLAGLVEGVNYRKQSTGDAEDGRPDFSFLLANDLVVNMDVKFPLENYKGYLDATDADAAGASLKLLVRDVRKHVSDVAKRGYIDTRGGTVNYVLLFLPSEQVYSLVLEARPDLIDEALHSRVVLASPFTLYAMLAVIRQASESANIMKTAHEVIALLGQFNKQWQKHKEEFDKLGKQLDTVGKTYDNLRTTRSDQLQKPLDKIEDLRTQRGLPRGSRPRSHR